jgi:hypothetical protein
MTNNSVKKAILPIALLAALCGCATLGGNSGPEGETITAEGIAPINGNFATARRDALAEAQRSAVEQVVGVFVSGQTQVQDATAVKQKLLASTQGFIKRYKITRETQSGGYYHVKIKASVLVQDISAALDKMYDPSRGRVAVFAFESVDGKPQPTTDSIAPVTAALEKLGYSVITPQPGADSQSVTSALDAAQAEHADLALIAEAGAYKIPPMPELGGQFSPYRTHMTLRLYTIADRRMAAEIAKEASGLDAAPEIAARKATAAAAETAVAELPAQIDKVSRSASTVALKVTGLGGLEQLRQFQELLRAIPQIEKAQLVSYSDGDASFNLRVREATGEELAAAILHQNRLLTLEAQGVTQYEVDIKAN